MVKRAANYSRNGLTDWILQRLSAVILGAYTIVILCFFITNPYITFQSWQEFILSPWMRIFTVISLASFVAHAWIGLWTVATDYIKSTSLRYLFHLFYGVVLSVSFIWGIMTVLV